MEREYVSRDGEHHMIQSLARWRELKDYYHKIFDLFGWIFGQVMNSILLGRGVDFSTPNGTSVDQNSTMGCRRGCCLVK